MVLESGLVREAPTGYELTGPLPPLAIPATLQDSLMARLDRLARPRGGRPARRHARAGVQLRAAARRRAVRRAHPDRELGKLVEAELLYQRGSPRMPPIRSSTPSFTTPPTSRCCSSTRQQYHQRIAQVLVAQFPGMRGEPARDRGPPLHRGRARRAGDQLLVQGRAARHRVLGQPRGDQLSRQGARAPRRRADDRTSARTWSWRCRRSSASPSCPEGLRRAGGGSGLSPRARALP